MEVLVMSKSTVLINDARVMSKGQVTIPKNIREALGVTTGDRVTFIFENGSVRVINSAVYAMQKFQEQMKGQAEKAGFTSEEDVADWITNTRREENAE
jgi:antitoxin PrlF